MQFWTLKFLWPAKPYDWSTAASSGLQVQPICEQLQVFDPQLSAKYRSWLPPKVGPQLERVQRAQVWLLNWEQMHLLSTENKKALSSDSQFPLLDHFLPTQAPNSLLFSDLTKIIVLSSPLQIQWNFEAEKLCSLASNTSLDLLMQMFLEVSKSLRTSYSSFCNQTSLRSWKTAPVKSNIFLNSFFFRFQRLAQNLVILFSIQRMRQPTSFPLVTSRLAYLSRPQPRMIYSLEASQMCQPLSFSRRALSSSPMEISERSLSRRRRVIYLC